MVMDRGTFVPMDQVLADTPVSVLKQHRAHFTTPFDWIHSKLWSFHSPIMSSGGYSPQ